MAEFLGGIKPGVYKKLTRTQRSYLWVGAFFAAFIQGFGCLLFGIALHNLPH